MTRTIAVIGAGAMGHGIAELAALAGFAVKLYDVDAGALEGGIEKIRWSLDKLSEKGIVSAQMAQEALERIRPTGELAEAAREADAVIEAVPENLALKREIFRELDRYAPRAAILATNTSSLPIGQIASATRRPERVVGMHFFNPPMLMTLVEVVQGERTSPETVEAAVDLAKALKKTPVVCRKDVRGFITSRIFEGFMGEAMWLVSRGEAAVRAVDARMKAEGFPMGPFELADLTGLDISYNVRREAGLPVAPVLEELIQKGHLGRKTGRGFYDYREGKGPDYRPEDAADFDPLPLYAVMANLAADLLERGAASPEEIDLAMRLGGGFPQGPLARADALGLDVILNWLEGAHEKHGDARYRPAALLREKVARGELGEKAGAGFFRYSST